MKHQKVNDTRTQREGEVKMKRRAVGRRKRRSRRSKVTKCSDTLLPLSFFINIVLLFGCVAVCSRVFTFG